MIKLTKAGLLAAVAALWLAATAQAHVNLHPNQLPANRFMSVLVRVPNERPNASTTKVDLLVPPGIGYVYTSPVPGWKILRPAENRVVWVATAGGIKPIQFMEFPLAFATPDRPGSTVAFKSLQYYSNGEIVRWIGGPTEDKPASQVAITAHDAPLQDLPGSVSGVQKLLGSAPLTGALAAIPLLFLGFYLGRRRRPARPPTHL